MSNKTLGLESQLYDYLLSVSLREPDILQQLREETAQHPMGQMQISPEQGQLMGLLVQLMGATKTLEIGVFTGYSSLCVALALPSNGQIVACDLSEEYTATAQRYWQRAGVSHKISLQLGPALKTLDKLLVAGQAGTFDFAFIDADKENYEAYYERALQLLRTGGLVAVDNVLWSGRVTDINTQDKNTIALRNFNEKLRHDPRVMLSMLPLGDGLTLALKRRWAPLMEPELPES